MTRVARDTPKDLAAPTDQRADLEPDAGALEMPEDMADKPDLDVMSWLGHCQEVEAFGPVFPQHINTWSAQDATAGAPSSPVVFVGSSSMRRWENLARAYSDYDPLQRGFGGSQLGEVAYYAQELIIRHQARGVVVYAGTNDISAGVSPAIVVERMRCLRERIGLGLGWRAPIVFIGILPTPARWASWSKAEEVNRAVELLAQDDPALSYADVPAAFLQTGQPPPDGLFVADKLHLSAAGYALWEQALRPTIERAINPLALATSPATAWAPGTRLLIDLGPSNPEDGAPTQSPDVMGQHWNNWHPIDGDTTLLPGERLSQLVNTRGERTGVNLTLMGGFNTNGLLHGGLRQPDAARLGSLAVESATSDFFYSTEDDLGGGLYLSGLDPNHRYTLRLFGARESAERRVTGYAISGATTTQLTLQSSGPGAGQGGRQVNDQNVATAQGVQPDAWGNLFIDVQRLEGGFAYLSALELVY